MTLESIPERVHAIGLTTNKPRYRYWESETHPRWRKAWTLAGGTREYFKRQRAKRGVPIMLPIERAP